MRLKFYDCSTIIVLKFPFAEYVKLKKLIPLSVFFCCCKFYFEINIKLIFHRNIGITIISNIVDSKRVVWENITTKADW